MTGFLARRLLSVVIVLAIMSLIIYGLIGLMPGDPIDLMITADPHLTPQDAERLKALYGLDRPLLERYAQWGRNALLGDFGYSRLYGAPAFAVLETRLVNTLLLMGTSFVLALALALPLGLLGARRPGSLPDWITNVTGLGGISLPPFWLALMLILLFAVHLKWLPPAGLATIGGGLGDRALHLILPVMTLTLGSLGTYVRFMRAAVIEVMAQDYIRTARAKGAGPWRVLVHHALRNALLPVITIVALSFGALFSGALVTETMFAYPGMGKVIYDAVLGNDFNLALAGLMVATLVTLLSNLAADIAYAMADPRITYR
ncbi:MAG TPA: ABC transporter permease [Stellaceae bacterium]|nr:ABC transporter permease [Stellaceae bacterium]